MKSPVIYGLLSLTLLSIPAQHALAQNSVQEPNSAVSAAPAATPIADAKQDEADAAIAQFYAPTPPPEEPYNPIADSTLPTPAALTTAWDPWEKANRKVHKFNSA